MKDFLRATLILFPVGVLLSLPSGCGSSELSVSEESDPAYKRGRAHLRDGGEEEALDDLQKGTYR